MNTKDKLFSKFLSLYYLTIALGGTLLSKREDREIYDTLAGVYLIDDADKLARFYELSCEEHYLEMNTLPEYERICRMLEYAKTRGFDTELTEDDKIILSAKRDSLRLAKEILPAVENLTPDSLREALLLGISAGNLYAMTVLSFLDITGYVVGKNLRRSEINFERAASWNNLDANLMIAYFDKGRARECIARMSAADKGSSGEELCNYIAEAYGVTNIVPDDNAGLLERAFCMGSVERNKYDAKFASIIHSDILVRADKKYIISTYKKETMSLYIDLPSDISADMTVSYNAAVLDGMPLERADEIRRIKRNLIGVVARANAMYKPLLLACRDGYIIDEYKRALAQVFAGEASVNIDASHLNRNDLLPAKENVFLRGISDTKKISTVFFIDACHKLHGEMATEISKYLRGDIRATFRLANPKVGFNMSGILPVLFSIGEPDPILCEYADVINLLSLRDDEKPRMIEDTLAHLSDMYKLERVTLTDEVLKILVTKSSEQIEETLDELVKYVACEGKSTPVDEETYKLVMNDIRKATVKFGF